MIKRVGVQLLPNWDISDAMVFDVVRKEMNIVYKDKEQDGRALKCVKYSEDHDTLII